MKWHRFSKERLHHSSSPSMSSAGVGHLFGHPRCQDFNYLANCKDIYIPIGPGLGVNSRTCNIHHR